jgi:hypothetical protein
MRKNFAAASIAALLVAGISLARADTTVGPGNVSITGQDSESFNLIAVDLANSTTLGRALTPHRTSTTNSLTRVPME